MGYRATVSANTNAPVEPEVTTAVQSPPVGNANSGAPLSGYVWRNGRAMPFTLETTAAAPDYHNALPEQLLIAAVLLVSFVAPIFHLFG